jgi:large subunit ribosomal protein L21
MYAIISDGGRQLKVEQGQELLVDYRDVPAGEKITFDRVMAVSDGSGDLKLGAPLVSGASVVAEVLGPEKGPKLVIQKLRRRKNFRKKTGHRSVRTRIRISKITG